MNQSQLEKQRIRRAASGNAVTKRYERTKKGKLMRTYRNMLSRVEGIQKRGIHRYQGKAILDREEFYAWALECPEFHAMFDAWKESGFQRKLSPSVDRIDTKHGYVDWNMRWLTHSENSRLGGKWAKSRVKDF